MDLLNKLNDKQREVVTHVDGPLLVIAGAGTGKTKTLTSRILYLLDAGIPANKILALTFTEKAATEMQTRVDEALPLSHEEVEISTFHSFSDKILKERGHEIGLSPSYRLLDKMNQWLFMKKHLFNLDLEYYRPLGNPSKFVFSLLSHFQRLKDENIAPEAYLGHAEKLAGQQNESDVAEEEAAKTLELARAFKQYQEIMIQESTMDFADLNYYAVKLFKERKSVLKEYQEQYQYILVDEFQDTNYIQSELVFLLSQSHGNLVVVGDDDQSIYKWRGASLSNIFHFLEKFTDAKKIVLTENYRSTQKILDASYALIQNNNPDRLEVKSGINKSLHSQRGDGQNVTANHFENSDQEAMWVSQKMLDLHNSGMQFGEMALLIRTNAIADNFLSHFKAAGIPYQVRSPRGFFRTDIVKDVLAFFRVLNDRDDDIAMYRLMTMRGIESNPELVQDYLRQSKKQSVSLYDLMSNIVETDDQLPGMQTKAVEMVSLIKKLSINSYKSPIGKLLYDFFEGIGLLQLLQQQEKPEDIQTLEQLSTFSRLVAEFDATHTDSTPKTFLEYLELLEEADMSFELDSDIDADAVQVLTVHSAKGLEFEAVFIPSLVQNRFPSTKRREAFDVPSVLVNEILPEKDYHTEEERRLMYVAMTRAKDMLFLSYSDFYAGSRKWKASMFLSELSELKIIDLNEYPEVANLVIKAPKPVVAAKNELLVKDLDRQHKSIKRFSYSQFDTFKTCPLKYKFRYIYKLAPPPSHASQFGSSVHETLNQFYAHIVRNEEVSLDLLKELYKKNWLPYGYTSKAHQLTRKKKGLEMLEEYYKLNSNPWVVPAFLERPFSIKIGEASISGRIDRVDKLEDGTYEVLDYKTGKSKIGEKLDKDLQLGLYAYVCREAWKLNVSKLSLYFLDDNIKESISIKDLKMDEILEKLGNFAGEINASDFAPTPGFPCGFCDYRLVCAAASARVG